MYGAAHQRQPRRNRGGSCSGSGSGTDYSGSGRSGCRAGGRERKVRLSEVPPRRGQVWESGAGGGRRGTRGTRDGPRPTQRDEGAGESERKEERRRWAAGQGRGEVRQR